MDSFVTNKNDLQKFKKIIETYRRGDMISTKDLKFAIPLLKIVDDITFLIPEYRLVAQDARRIWINMEDWLDSRNASGTKNNEN